MHIQLLSYTHLVLEIVISGFFYAYILQNKTVTIIYNIIYTLGSNSMLHSLQHIRRLVLSILDMISIR